jgi:choline-sulfatase
MRIKIERPLTIGRLKEIGIIQPCPALAPLDPAGDWQALYRAWNSSGFEEPGTLPGYLRLRKSSAADGQTFLLEVEQVFRDEPAQLHRVTAAVTCLNSPLATPLKWEMTSAFTDAAGHPLAGLTQQENARVTESGLEVNLNGRRFVRPLRGTLASDWGLMEAVQRLPFAAGAPLAFTLLEGLGAAKEDQQLVYRGRAPFGAESGYPHVHCFQHLGRGIIPFEYWVADDHRLLAAISGGRAFLLDELIVRESFPGLMPAGDTAPAPAAAPQPARRPTRPPKKDRPNILFILTDQQHADTIRAAGCPHLQTPALDRLCAEGLRFRESYCSHPICSPSRSTLFTGRMPSETGVWLNGKAGGAVREDIPNLGQWFSGRSDYAAVYAGKWHVPECHTDRIPGFRVICSGTEHMGNVSDPIVARACEAYLREPRGARPFLLVASLIQPHDICQWLHLNIRNPAALRYPPLEAELPALPANFNFDPREPAAVAWLRGIQQPALGAWTESQWRYYLWHYYRHVEMVDAEIARILQALDETGLADDTLVVLTSDHGEGLAHHQLVRKDFLYEAAAKVPLIARLPGEIPPGAADGEHLVSGLDILPTLCDFAGIPSPALTTARSLRPLLKRETAPWRSALVVETSARAQSTGDARETGRMLRSQRYKYIRYFNDPQEQLFDLETDPGETQNLAATAGNEAVLAEHRRLLREWERQLEHAPTTMDLRNLWSTIGTAEQPPA